METNCLMVVSCSGAINTGKYSDVVARQLMQSKQAGITDFIHFNIKAFPNSRGKNELTIYKKKMLKEFKKQIRSENSDY